MQHQTDPYDVIMCKMHPQRPVRYIHCKQKCSYPSRLICSTCFSEYKTNDGLERIEDVLRDPRVIMNSQDKSEQGIYNKLNDYFDFLDQDPDKLLAQFKAEIAEHIKRLEEDIKEGMENYNQFRKVIQKVKDQFDEALGFTQFRDAFTNFVKAERDDLDTQWKELEKTTQNFIIQFKDQDNQELKVAYQQIREMKMNMHMENQTVYNNFQENYLGSIELLKGGLQSIGILQDYSQHQFTTLCDAKYCFELLQRIKENLDIKPKVTLLFKASKHGMNAGGFWGRCRNQGPTITICKSRNGYVFGGYTPCKWIPSDFETVYKDASQKSFLFSYTRKEIYPLLSVDRAILCRSSYGPNFGGVPCNLHIHYDFQGGYSNMNGVDYSNQTYKIDNQKTHLMGNMTPQLVEMEVFLIEQ